MEIIAKLHSLKEAFRHQIAEMEATAVKQKTSQGRRYYEGIAQGYWLAVQGIEAVIAAEKVPDSK